MKMRRKNAHFDDTLDKRTFDIWIILSLNIDQKIVENRPFCGTMHLWVIYGTYFCHIGLLKILVEKLVKMLGFGQNWIFGQKFDFSNSFKVIFAPFFNENLTDLQRFQ